MFYVYSIYVFFPSFSVCLVFTVFAPHYQSLNYVRPLNQFNQSIEIDVKGITISCLEYSIYYNIIYVHYNNNLARNKTA